MRQKWLNAGLALAVGVALALGLLAYSAAQRPAMPSLGTQHFGSATFAGSAMVDGASDTDQLTVQGYTTQTSELLVLEQSDGTDVVTVTNAGALALASTLDVDGNISSGTGAVTVTDSVNVTGAVDFDSTLNVDGAATFVSFLYPSFADETITDGETLTPTVTVYNLDSAGAVTMTLAACSTDGQLLILVGDDANNITVNDTNVRTNDGGVQVIGQYDMISWICIDTEWVELSESNNS